MYNEFFEKELKATNSGDATFFNNAMIRDSVVIGTGSKEYMYGKKNLNKFLLEWSSKYEVLRPDMIRQEVFEKDDMVWVSQNYKVKVRERKTKKIITYPPLRRTTVYIKNGDSLVGVQEHLSAPDDSRP